MQPTLYWKNAIQQNLPWSWNPKTLYRGYIPSVTNAAAMIGSQFALAGNLGQSWAKYRGKDNEKSMEALLIGTFSAGYISGFWCGPIEMAMIQQQRFGMTLSNCLKKIVRDYGLVKGVFRGTMNTSIREGWIFILLIEIKQFGLYIYMSVKQIFCTE